MTDPVQLSRFRADVSQALARRGKALLLADDLRARVEALEPLEAYFIVKELGVDDALPILRHATHDQIRTFVDFDCWNGDVPDPVEIDAWLAPFASEGKEALAHAFLALESEIQTLFLQFTLKIHNGPSEDVPPAAKNTPRLDTPDGAFIIDALGADQLEINVLVLVRALYALDVSDTFALLTAAQWELPSDLADRAFHFRSNRLEELGFPRPADAPAIFAVPPPSPPAQKINPVPTNLPALYAASLTEATLLTRALGRISEPELLAAAESDLVYLINAAVIAYGEAPRDLRHVSDIAERVRDTVSLGLEVLMSGGEPLAFPDGDQAADDGATILRAWPLRDVFRHGHQAVTRLRAGTVALTEDPAVSEWLATVETEADDYNPERMDRELLRALLLPAPLHGGFDRLAPDRRKAFASLREIAEAEHRIDRLAQK